EAAIRALGDALVSVDEGRLARFLIAPMDTAVMAALKAGGFASHRTVAFVKLGRHRIVKYRLEGGGGAVTLNARWEQGAEGWRVGAVDVVKIELTQPAGACSRASSSPIAARSPAASSAPAVPSVSDPSPSTPRL